MTRATMRSARAVVACAAAALAVAIPAAAHASPADAFENKVKPVSGQLYTKAGKLELTLPAGLISFQDAFFSKYMASARLGYHFTEAFSLAVLGAIGGTSPTASTTVCDSTGCRPAPTEALYQVPGDIKWLTGVEVGFSPIYGKLNLFAEKAVHLDVYVVAGADLVAYRDVLKAEAVAQGAVPGNTTSVGGHIGLGTRIFLARFLALRLEVKDVLYSVPALDTGQLQNQLFGEVGLSFLIPVASREGR